MVGRTRTTLEIDDDVLMAAKELARAEGVSLGRIVARLLREALMGTGHHQSSEPIGGFRAFPRRGVFVNDDVVDKLRDSEGT